jgi:hypothetical protein
MNQITTTHLASLARAGFEVLEHSAGFVVVADPCLCMSGGRRWIESNPVRLTTAAQLYRFIIERE